MICHSWRAAGLWWSRHPLFFSEWKLATLPKTSCCFCAVFMIFGSFSFQTPLPVPQPFHPPSGCCSPECLKATYPLASPSWVTETWARPSVQGITCTPLWLRLKVRLEMGYQCLIPETRIKTLHLITFKLTDFSHSGACIVFVFTCM